MTGALDAWILRLKHENRVLGEAFEFVIQQLNARAAATASLIPLVTLTAPDPETATLTQGPTGTLPEMGVLDRTVETLYDSTTIVSTAFQLGTRYYNRINVAVGGAVVFGVIPIVHGQRAIIVNVGAGTLTLTHENVAAAAPEYRMAIMGGVDLALGPNDAVQLWYDRITQRWRVWSLGGSSPLPTMTIIEVDLGIPAKFSGFFQFVDASLVSGRPLYIAQSFAPYTGKGTQLDEPEMDQLVAVGSVTTVRGLGTVGQVYWHAVHGPMLGNVKFQYLQG